MMRLRIGISQRRDAVPGRDEARDALDVRLCGLLWELGFLPMPLASGIDAPAAYLEELALDGVVLSGGSDVGVTPARDTLERAALDIATQQNLPVLGICRGMQMINVFQGGSLRQIEGHTAVRHRITGPLVSTEGQQVNSYHDLALMRDDLGAELQAIAWSEDGVVEAIRHACLPWLGIMWHPERDMPCSDADKKLIKSHFTGNMP